MEDFFTDISLTKLLAIIAIGGLIFYSLFKENFMMTKGEKDVLNTLGEKTNNRWSGKTVMAIFYFVLILISLSLAFIFYRN